MTTRPGYIWSGSEWVAIGQEAAVSPFKYQATAPTSPATGDIWIDSSSTVNSIDSTQMLRWRKTMAGGETSLSGNDDASLPLTYTPGYEQLYINGVLQVRGVDYTATTGTTVTGLTALVANDVVEIFSAVAFAVSNVYTQTQSDSKYSPKTATGLNLVVPTSVSVGSGSASVATNGAITFTGASSVSMDGCFSSTYENYIINFVCTQNTSTATYHIKQRASGVDATATSYGGGVLCYYNNTTLGTMRTNGSTEYNIGGQNAGSSWGAVRVEVFSPYLATQSKFNVQGTGNDGALYSFTASGGTLGTNSYDGIKFFASAGTMTGTIRIYGYNNGA